MPKIRLMHILEATVGGTRRHLLDLCLGLPADRFQQHVVCSVLRDESFLTDVAALREAGIEVTILPMKREISLTSDWRCLRDLRRIMTDWRPQIVHGHSSKGGFLARLAARSVRPRPRLVYNPHGFAFQMRTSSWKQALYVGLERNAGRLTDVLVAACASQKDLALQHHLLPEERIRVVPNGIRAEEFQIQVDRKAIREELGLPAEAKLLGTVAALVPQKGVEHLVRAAVAVRRERPDVHLLIIGDGPLRGPLQRLAEHLELTAMPAPAHPNGIHFLGQRHDVPRLLAALDLFVLPSLWEGLPYVLLEAGAAGLPVVATAIPGNVDLIEEGRTGLLAPAGDPLELALTLFRALDDPRLGEYGHSLRDDVCRDYTMEKMIEGHVRVYEGLVGA